MDWLTGAAPDVAQLLVARLSRQFDFSTAAFQVSRTGQRDWVIAEWRD